MEKVYVSKSFYQDRSPERHIIFNKIHRADMPTLRLIGKNGTFTQAEDQFNISNGALRLTAMFYELLDQQFPIKLIDQKMSCRFPIDFAAAVSVHVNHLNRSLKDITGKTTSQLIADRIAKEAQILLILTEWNVCEIGYCLGFEEGPHFINFFKKNINLSPNAYRRTARLKEFISDANLA